MGTWTWTPPGKSCSETWQYRANGTRLSTSGEEVTQGNYEIPRVPGLLGFYRLTGNSHHQQRQARLLG
ncbi:hypothetical protein LP415_16115 [Polaromonas sp. P1(28)-8]|nr:hypothetical protein LP415_16115 [Polaromonas sp. P1(28)-8]